MIRSTGFYKYVNNNVNDFERQFSTKIYNFDSKTRFRKKKLWVVLTQKNLIIIEPIFIRLIL